MDIQYPNISQYNTQYQYKVILMWPIILNYIQQHISCHIFSYYGICCC